MTTYQLNMARDQVLTLEKRRRWLHWVFSYLAVSIVVIAAAAYYLTLSVVDFSARTKAMDEAERRFLRQRPGILSVEKSLMKVTSEMVGVTAGLDAVAQFSAMTQKSAAIMLGFAESLPQGVELGRLVLDGDGETVKVEVYVPASMKLDNGLTLPHMISRWESSPLLTNRVRQITSENSASVKFDGRDFMSWRFTGAMERDKQ